MTARNWAVLSGLLVFSSLVVVVVAAPGSYLRMFAGDVPFLVVCMINTAIFAANAWNSRGQISLFWALLSLGCLLWAVSAGAWVYYEVLIRKPMPEVDSLDVVLFLHMVPFMGAVALRPHWRVAGYVFWLRLIGVLLLLVFWVYVYAVVVLPSEFIVHESGIASGRYDLLYAVETGAVAVLLLWSTWRTRGEWRTVYGHLAGMSAVYFVAATFTNFAISGKYYFSGGFGDCVLLGCQCWLGWVALEAREHPVPEENTSRDTRRSDVISSRLAAVALLTVPVVGAWTLFWDPSLPSLRFFRLAATLLTMTVMGVIVSIRQHLQERGMMRLLKISEESLQRLRNLQSELLQKERLASVGLLAAGAAHEINNPITAIMGYSELLGDRDDLNPEARAWVIKIRAQAVRTSELVARLLRFARQSHAEKGPVDLAQMLEEIVPFFELQAGPRHDRLLLQIGPNLPPVYGSRPQLQQSIVSIVQNAFDAMEGMRGKLSIVATNEGRVIRLEFRDEGPGLAEPERVFDPFYTTKPVGKGTGLGLSAAYGVIQEHGGQITAENRAGGGAVIAVMLPAAVTPAQFDDLRIPPG